MRLAELIILLCLSSLAFGSDAVARTTILTARNGAKEETSSETLDAGDKHKSKRLHFRSEEYNNTSAEDKRVVPTGPNPLHNR